MNVIIKGLAMPKHCWQCRFKDSDDLCILLDDDCMKIWGEQKKLPDCPLVELPDHGDLIERDDAIAELEERIRANRYANAALVSELTRSHRAFGTTFETGLNYLAKGLLFSEHILNNAPVVIPAERSEDATD